MPALSPPLVNTAIFRCLLGLPAAEVGISASDWDLNESETPSRSLLVATGLVAACDPSDMFA